MLSIKKCYRGYLYMNITLRNIEFKIHSNIHTFNNFNKHLNKYITHFFVQKALLSFPNTES